MSSLAARRRAPRQSYLQATAANLDRDLAERDDLRLAAAIIRRRTYALVGWEPNARSVAVDLEARAAAIAARWAALVWC